MNMLKIMVSLGCLLSLTSAIWCDDGYYWDTFRRSCVKTCNSYIDLSCRPYGGLGVCWYDNFDIYPCYVGLSSGIMCAIIIPTVFVVCLCLCCSVFHCTKNRRKSARKYRDPKLNSKENTNIAHGDVVVGVIAVSENPQESQLHHEAQNIEIVPSEVLDKQEDLLVHDKKYPTFDNVAYEPRQQNNEQVDDAKIAEEKDGGGVQHVAKNSKKDDHEGMN